jgi:hypothetical protein
MNSDLLDEYCDMEYGHTDWEVDYTDNGNMVVTFFKEARPEYLADQEEKDDANNDK